MLLLLAPPTWATFWCAPRLCSGYGFVFCCVSAAGVVGNAPGSSSVCFKLSPPRDILIVGLLELVCEYAGFVESGCNLLIKCANGKCEIDSKWWRWTREIHPEHQCNL